MPPPDRSRLRELTCLIAIAAVSSLWIVTASERIGATFDEPVYLRAGLNGWRTGSHRDLLRMGTMPLPADVQTLPLYLLERWRGSEWNLDDDFASALSIARFMTLPFWWLLLVFAWRAGRMIGGNWSGVAAAAVVACEPNLLAHAGLATTDIALTATLVAFLVQYRSGRDVESRIRRVVVSGLLYGAALIAKASALAFAPICMVAVELERRVRMDWNGESIVRGWRPFVYETVHIGMIGLATAFLFCGSDWLSEPSFVAWSHGLNEGPLKSIMVPVAENLRIFSNAGEGIARQIKHNLRGHGAYLLGQSSDNAFWFYFPVLFTMKLAAPMLIAVALIAAVRRAALINWALFAAAALAVFSLNCRVQIGIRLVLPCVALLAVGLASAAVTAVRSISNPRVALAWRVVGIAGFGWMIVNSMSCWPDGLRFVNEFWGGTRGAYRLVSDSNYDWGQGLPELAAWQRRNDIDQIDVWYFGTDPAFRHLPVHDCPLHAMSLQSPSDVRDIVAGRRLAVGATVLYGHGLTPSHRRAAEFLRACRPVAEAGTFLIFDFRSMDSGLVRQSRQDRSQ